MRKCISALLMLIILLGCVADEKQNSVNFSIEGKYVCSNDYINTADYFEKFPKDTPAIIFLKDGSCEMVVNYLEGVSSVYGTYIIENSQISVEVTLEDSMFIAADDNPYYEPGTKFIDEKYIFSVISNEEIVIDRDFYFVRAGDSFIKSSS